MLQPNRPHRLTDLRHIDPDRIMDAAIAAGLTLLILTGFITSYRTLCQLAVTEADYPPWLAPAVPISLDLGIIVLSLRVLRAARAGRNAVVLRAIVAVLALGTVALNTSAADTVTAAILHAAPPAMFVICFESVVVGLRRSALVRQGLLRPRPHQISTISWLLGPRTTWATWKAFAIEDLQPPESQTAASSPPHVDAVAKRFVQPDRSALVEEALRANPSAPKLREILARQGVLVSLRTAQRLRAQFVADGRSASAGAMQSLERR